MSIAKLFVKVFGEDIFKSLNPEGDDDDDEAKRPTSGAGACDGGGLTLPEYVIKCALPSIIPVCHPFISVLNLANYLIADKWFW